MKDLTRSEKRILRKKRRKEKVLKFFAIIFCIVFFITILYIADISSARMTLKNDEKYAIYAKYQGEGILRVDIAGKSIRLVIKPIIDFFKKAVLRD